MRIVSIGSMVKSVVGMIGTRDLTTWEQSFVRSVAKQSGDGADTSRLSDRQVEILDDIYRRHFA